MKFRCHKCRTILTKELSDTPVELCEEDGKDLIPEGVTFQNDWSEGRWVINANDTVAMEVIGNPKRLSGCCDLDGCNGPNLVCQSCKSEVATAKYDCWMPRHIIIRAEGADIVP